MVKYLTTWDIVPLHLSGLRGSSCLIVEATPASHQTGQEWTTDIIIYRCRVSPCVYTVSIFRVKPKTKRYSALELSSSVPPGLDGAGTTEEVTVIRGNLASLRCIADGSPSPTISWLTDGVTLVPDRRINLLNMNTILQFSSVQVNNTGRYTCMANNDAGQASRHFNLKVLGELKQKCGFKSSVFDSW